MITNIFSIFDPSSYMIRSAWLLVITIILTTIKSKKFGTLKKIFSNAFKKEIRSLSSGYSNKIWVLMFWAIVIANLRRINPLQFSINAHPSIILPVRLRMWIAIILFNLTHKLKETATHLLPVGTPSFLIFPIITIEIIRNIIRPITLTIRIVANIIAGHLLIHLLARFAIKYYSILIFTPIAQLTLTTLEIAVAIIQAYIITVLLILYANEIH